MVSILTGRQNRVKQEPWFDETLLLSKGRHYFRSFAKSAEFHKGYNIIVKSQDTTLFFLTLKDSSRLFRYKLGIIEFICQISSKQKEKKNV